MLTAPFDPVCDYRALPTKSAHEGNYFDPVTGNYATVVRTTPKTVYDAETGRIRDVAAGYLAVRPYSNSRAGGAGYEAIIEEARTNAYLDSYFAAADITAAWASDGTLTRSTDVPAVYGTHVAKAVYTGTAGDSNATKVLLSQERPYSAAQTVTTSAWARGSATGLTVQRFIEAIDVSNAVLGTVTANITLGAWARSTLTYANLPAGTVKTRSGIRAIAVDTGDTVTLYVDAAQSEVGAFPTSYIPTTTAAATRSADVVTVPTTGWAASAGTFVAVAKKRSASSGNEYLVACGPDAANRLVFYHQSPSNIAIFAKGGDNVAAQATATGVDASAQVFVGTWDTTTLTAYVGGSAGSPAATDETTAIPGVTAYIGSNGSLYFYGSIARLTVYAEALSDAQIADLNPLIAGVLPHDPPKPLSLGGGISCL